MNLTHNNPPPFRTFQGSESRGEKLMNTISHLDPKGRSVVSHQKSIKIGAWCCGVSHANLVAELFEASKQIE